MRLFYKLVFLLFFIVSIPFGRELIVLGFHGQGAPAVEKSYDRLFREKLSITQGIQLSDYVECQRYRQLINFDNYPVISKEQIEPIAKYTQDTAYFVWGTVNKCKIAPARRYFFQARVKGELSITLNMYSLADRKICYSGTIEANIYEPKGFVFFTPISKSVHVSALEQTDMLEKLEYEAVKKGCQVISAVIRSDTERNGTNSDTAKQNEKAVNDMLSAPSVEAPEAKNDSTINSSAENNLKADTVSTNAIKKTINDSSAVKNKEQTTTIESKK